MLVMCALGALINRSVGNDPVSFVPPGALEMPLINGDFESVEPPANRGYLADNKGRR
jgi:hypothetical protein